MNSTQLQKNILEREFYARDSMIAAQELLGKILVRKLGDEFLAGRITETEAYLSSGDEAAHNFKGMTPRNRSLYKDAGHVYVHQMRQWFLLDIVVEAIEIPGSVLIRSVEPLSGIETMKNFRNSNEAFNVANGPGKICQAFGIDRSHDGLDITVKNSPIFISDDVKEYSRAIIATKRIGISKAKDKLLRFHLQDSSL